MKALLRSYEGSIEAAAMQAQVLCLLAMIPLEEAAKLASGVDFTCFTSTRAQKLTQKLAAGVPGL